MALWGLYETQAEKELKKLKAEAAERAAAEAAAANKPVTLADVRAVALEYGKQLLGEAKEVSAELRAKAEIKTAEIKDKTAEFKNTVVEKFNEKSSRAIVTAAETAFNVSKTVSVWKKKIEDKLKK